MECRHTLGTFDSTKDNPSHTQPIHLHTEHLSPRHIRDTASEKNPHTDPDPAGTYSSSLAEELKAHTIFLLVNVKLMHLRKQCTATLTSSLCLLLSSEEATVIQSHVSKRQTASRD